MLNIEYYWDKYFAMSEISSTFALAKQEKLLNIAEWSSW
jgi:hypothetical protein